MKKNRLLVPVSAFVVGIFASLAIFNVLKSYSPSREPIENPNWVQVGSVQTVTGQVESRKPKSLKFASVTSGHQLHSGEVILTQAASEAIVILEGGASLKIEAGSRLAAETDATRAGAVVATVIEGDVQVLSPGKTGSLRLFKDGKQVAVAEMQGTTEGNPVVRPPDLGTEPVEEDTAPVVEAPLPETSAPSSSAGSATSSSGSARSQGTPSVGDSTSITNDEIRRRLRSQSPFFQRCYLTYLNRTANSNTPSEGGTVTVAFVIQPSGKVHEAKIVRTDFQDATLNNCVVETVERTSFRAFASNAVPVLEFPVTLK